MFLIAFGVTVVWVLTGCKDKEEKVIPGGNSEFIFKLADTAGYIKEMEQRRIIDSLVKEGWGKKKSSSKDNVVNVNAEPGKVSIKIDGSNGNVISVNQK